jgi:hypothetical protein
MGSDQKIDGAKMNRLAAVYSTCALEQARDDRFSRVALSVERQATPPLGAIAAFGQGA